MRAARSQLNRIHTGCEPVPTATSDHALMAAPLGQVHWLHDPEPPKIIILPSLLEAARDMGKALEALGVPADFHDGYGLALVSVWVGLVVWCDGDRYWWRTGWDPQRKRVIYACHSALEPERAARLVAFRYAELRRSHPLTGRTSKVTAASSESAS